MTTIELERGVAEEAETEEPDGTDDEFCHLYEKGDKTSLCGIPVSQDTHANSKKHEHAFWQKGMLNCPICGVKICLQCVLEAG